MVLSEAEVFLGGVIGGVVVVVDKVEVLAEAGGFLFCDVAVVLALDALGLMVTTGGGADLVAILMFFGVATAMGTTTTVLEVVELTAVLRAGGLMLTRVVVVFFLDAHKGKDFVKLEVDLTLGLT